MRPSFSRCRQTLAAYIFLATWNLGASSAQTLTRILNASLSSKKSFSKELWSDSPTLQEVNDGFKDFTEDLKLFSFFECKPMSFGGLKNIIVMEASTTMGLLGERTAHINADHRWVCRFDRRTDSDYTVVSNAFVEVSDKTR